MEILKILDEQGKDLYLEDLDFFEAELDTGEGYNVIYKAECKEKINQLRKWLKGDIVMDGENENPTEPIKPKKKQRKKKGNVVLGLGDVLPENAIPNGLTKEQIVFNTIEVIRKDKDYKTRFKKFIKDSLDIDEAFIDKCFSLFEPWELETIISVKQMSEEFLEKYFDMLDSDKIAKHQMFSEGFFMKHFSKFDANAVLEHGKNEWRKKENRSKQLDVFLRLKGIKI